MTNQQLPQEGIPVDELLKVIGELFLQVRMANAEIRRLHEQVKALETKNKKDKPT